MTTYSALQQRADLSIKKNGKHATLRKASAASYDPVTGVETGATSADHAVSIVEANFRQQEIDGTLIRQDDKKALMSAYKSTADPEVDDSIVIDSDTFNIVSIKSIQPGDTVIYYELQLRR